MHENHAKFKWKIFSEHKTSKRGQSLISLYFNKIGASVTGARVKKTLKENK